jgi:hypothetical protein
VPQLALAAGPGVVAGGPAGPRAKTIGCGSQSEASFPGAYSDPAGVRVGPLVFVSGRNGRDSTPDQIAHVHGAKSPALLRPGHTAVVSVDPVARSYARLAYSSQDRARFRRLPHTMRLVACSGRRARSHVGGHRVTFWSGFFVVRDAPACVPLTITIDGGRPRHRTLALARPSCD